MSAAWVQPLYQLNKWLHTHADSATDTHCEPFSWSSPSSDLTNASSATQHLWTAQPDGGLRWRQYSRICYPFAHVRSGCGRGHIQIPCRWYRESKASYDKILFCGEKTRRDGLKYFWMDTNTSLPRAGRNQPSYQKSQDNTTPCLI